MIKATGSSFLGGTDGSTEMLFQNATPDGNAMNAPSLEYPLDGVVLPGNLPAIELQWSQAADNDTYRVHVTAPDVLDVYLYTKTRELTAPAATWTAIGQSTLDTSSTWTVEGVGPSKMKRTSTPRGFTITSDTIDDSAIYVWQSSTGSFHVIDMIKQKEIVLPTNAPALQPNQPCSGCHRISRDGKRFARSCSTDEVPSSLPSFTKMSPIPPVYARKSLTAATSRRSCSL